MIKNINIKKGRIDYDEFNLDPDKSLAEQSDLLLEDLLQISYLDDKYVIDVGWYPEFDVNGNFIIYVIKKLNWEDPLYKVKCNDIQELIKNLQFLIDKVDKLISTC